MLLRTEIGEQLIRYTPPGRPNRTDFATFAWEVSKIKDENCKNGVKSASSSNEHAKKIEIFPMATKILMHF